MNNIIVNPFEQYLELENRIRKTPDKVLKTFSERLNNKFDGGGIEPTNVIMIGAKYGVGKTYFALNWMLHSITEGQKVVFFSLDMDYSKIMIKIIRHVMNIGKQEALAMIRNDKIAIREKLKEIKFFDNLKIYTNETKPISFREISFICNEEKPDIVFIDHFGKIYGMGQNIFRETKLIAEYLRQMKTKINAIFVVLIQMRKENAKTKSQNAIPPFKDDFKGAGDVGEDADVMIALARPDLDNDCPEEKRRTIVGVLRKNRLQDDTEMDYLFWKYDPVSTRMHDIFPPRA